MSTDGGPDGGRWTPAGPPVLITAGNRGKLLPAQFERFARLGDGIITTYVDAGECRMVRERGDEALARLGRALPRFPLCVYTTVRPDDDPPRARRESMEFLAAYYGGGVHQRGTMGLGPAAEVIGALDRYAEAGVTDLCVRFVGDDQRAQLKRFTRDVLPALRGRRVGAARGREAAAAQWSPTTSVTRSSVCALSPVTTGRPAWCQPAVPPARL